MNPIDLHKASIKYITKKYNDGYYWKLEKIYYYEPLIRVPLYPKLSKGDLTGL